MRWIWWAAIVAGVSYFFADDLGVHGAALIAWKGAGVGLLAAWAATQAESGDGRLLALVLALHALGDVLLETHGLTVGAVAFLAGHIVAVALYLRNRRPNPSSTQIALATALLIGTPLISWLLTRDPLVTLYATGLGAMAAAAWASRFPRYRLGLGAVLFVISDLLIFARMGPLAGSAIPDLLVWPTYFGGQALIATAGVRTLRAG
ncbi:lysoplasmalogenase [Sphingomonas gilva]|uniref:Lysoplasmalogenase n=1 Tax=Sphingomonas gilva TaxID=2305907 RepID=A0A396RL62_9SPHN|nr:lysoplasmalogenase family protein [Sphingomonas gilva]RHW17074.1 lysoplasmalogenase [Sphingomonas gilva]